MVPAAKGHPSDDHKECHGHRGHSSHNLHSGQQVCREKRGPSEEAELKEELGKRELGLGLVSLGSKVAKFGLPKVYSPLAWGSWA